LLKLAFSGESAADLLRAPRRFQILGAEPFPRLAINRHKEESFGRDVCTSDHGARQSLAMHFLFAHDNSGGGRTSASRSAARSASGGGVEIQVAQGDLAIVHYQIIGKYESSGVERILCARHKSEQTRMPRCRRRNSEIPGSESRRSRLDSIDWERCHAHRSPDARPNGIPPEWIGEQRCWKGRQTHGGRGKKRAYFHIRHREWSLVVYQHIYPIRAALRSDVDDLVVEFHR